MADTLPGVTCEWCGGPMVWTIVRGEQWVACRDGNHDQGELFGLPPLDVKEGEEFHEKHWEPSGKAGVVPYEGDDASESDHQELEPPVGWLSALWEGHDYGPSER